MSKKLTARRVVTIGGGRITETWSNLFLLFPKEIADEIKEKKLAILAQKKRGAEQGKPKRHMQQQNQGKGRGYTP